jgi:hypothetical protein
MLLKSVNILAGARSPLATSAPAAPALVTAVIAPALAAPMMAIPAAMVAIIVLDVVNYGGQYGGAYNQTKRGRHVFIMRA